MGTSNAMRTGRTGGGPPPRRFAFLFTDIEGSTRLWERHPQAMPAALARHDAILAGCIGSSGGTVFKTVGDAFCAVFTSASSAVFAALDAQRSLRSEPWGETGELRVRMAVHSGTAIEREGDFFGPALNRVARLLSAGHGRQVLLSESAASEVEGSLPEGASLRELGRFRLRDLGEPDRIFQLLHHDLPAQHPPLRSLEAFSHNLPTELTSFIGRGRERAEVERLLDEGRLVTLTGIGGSGKTRLALKVAAERVSSYHNGAWLVELANVRDPGLVPEIVANVLAVVPQPGRPIDRAIADHLRTKELLLLLDNCEHLLLPAAQLVSTILEAAPAVRVLATSRQVLGMLGERVYRVPSLGLPAGGLERSDAISFFVERARLSDLSFTLTEENEAAVAQIAVRLDGIPLALELAASRVGAIPVELIASRIDDRFALLGGGSGPGIPRQQTLRALFDWSHELLSDAERVLFRRLAVFSGGWTLQAAEAVVSDDQVKSVYVLDLLSGLADKSLAVLEERSPAGYRFLETTRQYAGERLAEAGEGDEVRRRHLEFFETLTAEAEPELTGPHRAAWLERLRVDMDNVRAALAWCESSSERAGAGLRISGALSWYWIFTGRYVEGRRWLEHFLEHTDEATSPPQERARALLGSGVIAADVGDLVAARRQLEESLVLARSIGDRRQAAHALSWLGLVLNTQIDLEPARAILEESVEMFRQLDDPWGLALSLDLLAQCMADQDQLREALPIAEESLALFRSGHDVMGLGVALTQLGKIELQLGRSAAALEHFDEALVHLRSAGQPYLIAYDLYWVRRAADISGQRFQAEEALRELLLSMRDLNNDKLSCEILACAAEHAAGLGSWEAAARLAGAAKSLAESLGTVFETGEDPFFARRIEDARSRLGHDAFDAARRLGSTMAPEDAAALAISQLTGPA